MHWQYAYTPEGLDPVTKQWLRFLTPERLKIDELKMSHDQIISEKPPTAPKHKINLKEIDQLVISK